MLQELRHVARPREVARHVERKPVEVNLGWQVTQEFVDTLSIVAQRRRAMACASNKAMFFERLNESRPWPVASLYTLSY